jgi:hypothetical protein
MLTTATRNARTQRMSQVSDFGPRYKRANVRVSRVGDDLVIFDERTGHYFAASAVGADIWDMLADPVAPAEICDRLLARYAIDRATCEAQVATFLSSLRAQKLLEENS